MIGLIKKYLYMSKNYGILFVLCSLAYILGYLFIKVVIFENLIEDTEFSRFTLSILPLIMVMEFVIKSQSFEHLDIRTEKYTNILPVSRFNIISSKYTGAVLFSLLGLVMSCICYTIFTYMDNTDFSFTIYKYFIIAFFFYIIMLSLSLPLLVNGVNEPISLFAPITIIITPLTIIMVANNLSVNDLIEKIPKFFNRHNISINEITIYSFIISMIFMCISAFIAAKFYQRREF